MASPLCWCVEGLEFETEIASDTALLHELVQVMINAGIEIHVHVIRHAGGVTSARTEIAQTARIGMLLDEAAIPISEEVKGACEILGLDLLYVANEGKLLAVVAANNVDATLESLHSNPLSKEAGVIGTVVSDHPGFVMMKTRVGGMRVVDMLSGEQLPQIC